MNYKIFKELTVLVLFLNGLTLFSQEFTFKTFGLEEGICHPFVYAINQDQNGYLWAATGEGLCRFNGHQFQPVSTDSISKAYVNLIYRDSQNRLWFAHNEPGKISYLQKKQVVAFKHNKEINSIITGITELNGRLIFATQFDGLIIQNTDGSIQQVNEGLENVTISSILAFKEKLIIGAQEGLYVFTLNENKLHLEYQPDDLAYINIQSLAPDDEQLGVWLGSEDMGLYKLNYTTNNYLLKHIDEDIGLQYANIQHILHDTDGYLWLSTLTSGVFKIKVPSVGFKVKKYTNYNKSNGLNTNFIKQVFFDAEDNIWLATYESGLAQLLDEALVIYNETALNFDANITAIAGNDSVLWLGGEAQILEYNPGNPSRNLVYTQKNGIPNDQVTNMCYDSTNNSLFIGTENNGVYLLKKGNAKKYFNTNNSLGNSINHIAKVRGKIYISTQNGIYVINTKTETESHYTTAEGLPYNNVYQVVDDKNDGVIIVTRSNGLYRLNEQGAIEIMYETQNYEFEFRSAVLDANKNIWIATNGNGILGFTGDSLTVINKQETGLRNNYCYSINYDHRGYLWTGHSLGLSKVDLKDYQIKVFDNSDGISGAVNLNASLVTKNGLLTFGTNKGLIIYDVSKEKENTYPPFENIVQVTINDKVYDHSQPIILPYAAYKIRIDYLGINYRDPNEVTYRYKLEGYDLDWSITEFTYANYPRVEDGTYTFRMKAYNSKGISDDKPVTFKLVIQKPIWKQWWFIALCVIILLAAIFFIIKYRERKQKQLQEYLQRSLDERTREVVEQKEEIELKNRDITDSINYAQRIQESILPPLQKLKESFSGCFIYYAPRDIVSGDFYWFGKVNDTKFTIICADSTGHGVPGAFMSMIGTTLIKDICMRSDVESPAEILHALDAELSLTLNQNHDAEKPNDGMDVVVSEIDLNTNEVRYASAMRPIIFYKDGEQIYMRGSRSSIGGQYSKEKKEFDEGSIQLSKGDIIYMFSDGYPDQFGGPMGKKFKMARLKNLLRDIHQKPMEEQYNYVKSTFNLWREDLDQVDDVLFMGIKI